LGIAKTLAVRAVILCFVVIAVLLFTAVLIGATGLSEKIYRAMMQEQLRAYRTRIAAHIHNQTELNLKVKEFEKVLIKYYGLDKPWYYRLPDMMWRIMVLDLGNARSAQTASGSIKISDIIMERLPRTILLVTTAEVIVIIIGLLAGTKLSTIAGSLADRSISLYAAFSYALPAWWLGIILILVFGFYLRWFPTGGMYSTPPPPDLPHRILDLLWHAFLPILELVIALSGSAIYIYRSILLTTAQEDFVTVARAKGLPENIVLKRYILRPSAPPILTNIILGLAGTIAGAILTETVFQWPGMGLLYYEAILSMDDRLILALTYMFTVVYVIARFILEVLYVVVDPRVRY